MNFLQRYPYFAAALIATMLAVALWLCMPAKYTAITKLGDETKETDLVIGLDEKRAGALRNLGEKDGSMDDMATYCKVLKTEDFVRSIADKNLPQKGMTYGQYLGEKDTISTVTDCIIYNYSSKYETLTIGFTDQDPTIASQMLDSVTAELQRVVTAHRHKKAEAALRNAVNQRIRAYREYKQTQAEYALFEDTHGSPHTQEEQQQEIMLQKRIRQQTSRYNKAIEACVRQQTLMRRAYLSFAVIQNNTVPKSPDGSVWTYILSFIFISQVLTFWWRKYLRNKDKLRQMTDMGNIFSPWMITLLVWGVVITGVRLLGDKIYPLQRQFYVCIVIWVSIFCASSLITYVLCREQPSNRDSEKKPLYLNKCFFYVVLCVSFVITALYARKVLGIVGMFNTANLMQAIRMLTVYGDGLGVADISFCANKAMLFVALWAYPRVPLKVVMMIVVMLIINSVSIMDKTTLFFVVFAVMFVLYERGRMRLWQLALGVITACGLFFVLSALRDRGDVAALDPLYFISNYIFANPVAFGYLPQSVGQQVGANTFFLLYYYLCRLGIGNYEVVDVVQEMVFVPIQTNLYTIMQPFYVDFGTLGVAFFALVYGVGMGWCYSAYRNGNSTGKAMYTYMFIVLALQFGQEQIFLGPVGFLRIWLLVYIMTQSSFKLRLR